MKWRIVKYGNLYMGRDSLDGHWFISPEGSTKTWFICVDDWKITGVVWYNNGIIIEDLPSLRIAKQYVELLIENNPQAWEKL